MTQECKPPDWDILFDVKLSPHRPEEWTHERSDYGKVNEQVFFYKTSTLMEMLLDDAFLELTRPSQN
jgi:hypothetical protein